MEMGGSEGVKSVSKKLENVGVREKFENREDRELVIETIVCRFSIIVCRS